MPPNNPRLPREEGVERHAVRLNMDREKDKALQLCHDHSLTRVVLQCHRLVAPHSETIGASSDRPIPSLFIRSCRGHFAPCCACLSEAVVVQLAGHGHAEADGANCLYILPPEPSHAYQIPCRPGNVHNQTRWQSSGAGNSRPGIAASWMECSPG